MNTQFGTRRRWSAFVAGLVFLFSGARVETGSAATSSSLTPVFTFDGTKEPEWVVVNDGVMGGVSSSRVTRARGVLRFDGRVRLENNGGFASTRSFRPPKAVEAVLARGSSIDLRMRGTSPVNVTLNTGDGWYWALIQPTATWSTMEIPYRSFMAMTRFGEPTGGPPYAGQPVTRFGLLIANAKAERFNFEVDSINVG